MIETLINFYINILKQETDLQVINAYNTEQEISLNGVIAVNCTGIQIVGNGIDATLDRIYTITISGLTLFSEDTNRKRIMQIAENISRITRFEEVKLLDDVYGYVIGDMDINTDEQSNVFVLNISVYTI